MELMLQTNCEMKVATNVATSHDHQGREMLNAIHIYRIVRKLRQFPNKRFMHLVGGAFEEPPAAAEKERVARKHGLRIAVTREEVADVTGGVAGRRHARHIEPADLDLVTVRDLLGESLDAVISAEHGQVQVREKLHELGIPACEQIHVVHA